MQDANFNESRQLQRVSQDTIKEVRKLLELNKHVLQNQGQMKATQCLKNNLETKLLILRSPLVQ